MTANAFHNIAQIETSLWEAADQLRANSNLTATEYSMPVLGVIFLRHATNRYQTALQAIEAAQAAGTMPKRPLGQRRLHQAPRFDAARGRTLRHLAQPAFGGQSGRCTGRGRACDRGRLGLRLGLYVRAEQPLHLKNSVCVLH